MKTAKFWLAQIAMIAMISLIFGSPVFADPSFTAVEKRQGAQSDNASDQGKDKAHSNAKGFGSGEVTGESTDEDKDCVSGEMDPDTFEICP